jgi:hypothetical protein
LPVAAANPAAAAVEGVEADVGAIATAPRAPAWTGFVSANAHALIAVRRRFRADVPACAAVVGVGVQEGAGPVTRHCALDAGIKTGAADALAKLIGSRIGATEAAAPAIVEVVLQVGAVGSTTSLAIVAAVVATGSTVGVGSQVAARTVANRTGAADIASTRASQAAGIALHARQAERH